jgi:hypothetical protein
LDAFDVEGDVERLGQAAELPCHGQRDGVGAVGVFVELDALAAGLGVEDQVPFQRGVGGDNERHQIVLVGRGPRLVLVGDLVAVVVVGDRLEHCVRPARRDARRCILMGQP